MTLAVVHKRSLYKPLLTTVLCAWLAFLVSAIVFAARFPLMSIVGSIPGIAFVGFSTLLLLIVALSDRRRESLALSLAALFLSLGQLEWVGWPKDDDATVSTQESVSVLNWNTLMWDEKKDTASFYDFLQSQNADIYILQEALYSASEHDHVNDDSLSEPTPITTIIDGFGLDYVMFNKMAEMQQHFPDYFIEHHQQFVVLSKYPIVEAWLDPSDQFQTVDIDINGKMLRIFNTHIVLHLEFKSPFSRPFYQALSRRFEARSIAFDRLANAVSKTETDYIVSGDFNSPKAMGTMRSLKKDHDDLFTYGEDRLVHTFEFNNMRIWRFDYLFANKDRAFSVERFADFPVPELSDHNAQRLILNF